MRKVLTLIDLFHFLVDCLIVFFILFYSIFFIKAEEQLREKVQEFIELQNRYDNERTDLMVK